VHKVAIVDIDNTLWQFCDPFYEELRKINEDFPRPEQWDDWNMWVGYCAEEEFYRAIGSIHLRQDSEEFVPYPEAKGFLTGLRANGYHVTIASHRSPEFMGQTQRWLERHELHYDDIHLSYHKTRLFNAGTTVVVDDSPHVLEKAAQSGALATGLLFPWNKAFSNNGFRLCSTLNDILAGILEHD